MFVDHLVAHFSIICTSYIFCHSLVVSIAWTLVVVFSHFLISEILVVHVRGSPPAVGVFTLTLTLGKPSPLERVRVLARVERVARGI